MIFKVSSKESKAGKVDSGFLKGVIVGAICVGLLSTVGFTYLSQEKRVSQEEILAQSVPFGINHFVLDDAPVFSSPEWLAFSKASAAKNQKDLDNSTDEDFDAIWWPTMDERKLTAKRSQDENYIGFFDRFSKENAKTLAIKNCMGTPSEDINHLRELYSEGLAEGQVAMKKAMAELSTTICKK